MKVEFFFLCEDLTYNKIHFLVDEYKFFSKVVYRAAYLTNCLSVSYNSELIEHKK